MILDLEKYKEYFNKNDMFSVNSGMKLVEIWEGYSRVETTIDENSMNYMGSMHGGLLYTMADVAAGTAAVSYGRQVVTLNAFVDYIKPVFSGKVIAEGKVISNGKTIVRCNVDIHDGEGTTFCRASVSMFNTSKDVTLIKS